MKEEIKTISENFSNFPKYAIVGLITRLTDIAEKYDRPGASSAFEKFLNFDTLNFLCDSKLEKIPLGKWAKPQIISWLEQNELKSSEHSVFNQNALLLAMNYEADTHKNVVDKADDQPRMAYDLAVGALQKAGYIDSILSDYD